MLIQSGVRIQHRDLLILDTGPITELVLFHAVHHYRFEKLRRRIRFFLDEGSYRRCGKFVASFRHKTTSASVVAELHYWIRETDRQGQSKLWNRVHEEFKQMDMGEEVVRLLEMQIDLVVKLGPVDIGLLELARRHAERNPLILTVDNALAQECERAKISVSLLREVVTADY